MSGFPPAVDAALLVAWLAVLAVTVARYRRGGLSERRLLLLAGLYALYRGRRLEGEPG